MVEGGDNARDGQGRFAAGNPGGPGGSRRRSSDLRRAVEEAVSPEHVAAIVRRATRMALEGDLPAMRLVLDRVCGRAADAPAESEPLGIQLPPLKTVADCNVAIQRLADGICQGTIDSERAKLLIDAVQARLKAIETTELEVRIAELEETAKSVDHSHRRRGR